MYAYNHSDNTTDSYYVQSRDIVPLKEDFKPAMKVLSRKPANTSTASNATSGLGQLTIDDDDDDEKQKQAMTLEERQAKAQKDREEKQRKYEEARQRLFGTEKGVEKKPSAGDATPPRQNGGSGRQSRNRGGVDGRPTSSAGNKTRQLYDPNDSMYVRRPDGQGSSGRSTPSEQLPIRNPRGPDGTVGFAPRVT